MKQSKKIALAGMMCALAVVIMSMGGMIPLATFCCPVLASLALIPVFVEYGKKAGLGAWIAISALSLMLCPDKEAALLMAFLGHYPVIKWQLEKIRKAPLRLLAKLGIFNFCVAAMYLSAIFLLRMDRLMQEYLEAGMALTIATLVLGNITMIVYDRMLMVMTVLYLKRLRGRLMK